jgi:hypothetical protein
MTPDPDQVYELHHVAAGLIVEKVKAEVTVEQQHRQGRGQDRKCRDD